MNDRPPLFCDWVLVRRIALLVRLGSRAVRRRLPSWRPEDAWRRSKEIEKLLRIFRVAGRVLPGPIARIAAELRGCLDEWVVRALSDEAADLQGVIRSDIRQWSRRTGRRLRSADIRNAVNYIVGRLAEVLPRRAESWFVYRAQDERGYFGRIYRSLGHDASGRLRENGEAVRWLNELFPSPPGTSLRHATLTAPQPPSPLERVHAMLENGLRNPGTKPGFLAALGRLSGHAIRQLATLPANGPADVDLRDDVRQQLRKVFLVLINQLTAATCGSAVAAAKALQSIADELLANAPPEVDLEELADSLAAAVAETTRRVRKVASKALFTLLNLLEHAHQR